MKFINPFRKKTTFDTVYSPGVEGLQQYASAFVQTVLDNADDEQARVIELAVKNGTLSVTVNISPKPGILIHLDPGAAISLVVGAA